MPAAERRGVLWDCYRQLTEAGWTIDCMSYTTAFRSSPLIAYSLHLSLLVMLHEALVLY